VTTGGCQVQVREKDLGSYSALGIAFKKSWRGLKGASGTKFAMTTK